MEPGNNSYHQAGERICSNVCIMNHSVFPRFHAEELTMRITMNYNNPVEEIYDVIKQFGQGKRDDIVVMFSIMDSDGRAVIFNIHNKRLTMEDIHKCDTSIVDSVIWTVLNSNDSIKFLTWSILKIQFISIHYENVVQGRNKHKK